MRYPGGKGKTYHQIINLLPPHKTYIETHLGGGAVVIRNRLLVDPLPLIETPRSSNTGVAAFHPLPRTLKPMRWNF